MPGRSGKPFDQCRHRRNVTQSQADAAEHSVAEIDDPELMKPNAEGADKEAAAEA